MNPHEEACKLLMRVFRITTSIPSAPSSAAPNAADSSRIERWDKMSNIGDKIRDERQCEKDIQVFQRRLSDFADVEHADCLARTLSSLGGVYLEAGSHAKALTEKRRFRSGSRRSARTAFKRPPATVT